MEQSKNSLDQAQSSTGKLAPLPKGKNPTGSASKGGSSKGAVPLKGRYGDDAEEWQ